MPYYASKNGIKKEIQRHTIENYLNDGWEITQNGSIERNSKYYEDVERNRLEPIIINKEVFVGYSSFFCINTKTYVEEPTRTLDGSIPNINDYITFIVPRVQISFDYMTISDFRRFLKAITPNEFLVEYYDYELDMIVKHKMYIEPREMATIYNKGYEILAVTGEKISLIGTLNDDNKIVINYYDNVKYSDIVSDGKEEYILLDKQEMLLGNWYSIRNGNQYAHNKSEDDTKTYKFVKWNTKPNGDGLNYFSNESIQAINNFNLYAQWEESE